MAFLDKLIKKTEVKIPTLAEQCMEYLEDLMSRYQIDNVIVTDGYYTGGRCGKANVFHNKTTIQQLKDNKRVDVTYEIPNEGNYILVPEFTYSHVCARQFYVWVHEIGHIHHFHQEKKNDKSLYFQEYEAEVFALQHFVQSGLFSQHDFDVCLDDAKDYVLENIKISARKRKGLQFEEIDKKVEAFIGKKRMSLAYIFFYNDLFAEKLAEIEEMRKKLKALKEGKIDYVVHE